MPLERSPSAKVPPSFLQRIQGSCVSVVAADWVARGSHETMTPRSTEAPGSTEGGKMETEPMMGRLWPMKTFTAYFWRISPSDPEMEADRT